MEVSRKQLKARGYRGFTLVELLTETEEPVEVDEVEIKEFTPTDLQQFEDAEMTEDEFVVTDDSSFEEEMEIEVFDDE